MARLSQKRTFRRLGLRSMALNHVPAVILGTAIGDALGMPFESYDCSVHPMLSKWLGGYVPGNYHKLDAGRWTDDTEMTIELAKSMLEENCYSPEAAGRRYVAWAKGNPTGMG